MTTKQKSESVFDHLRVLEFSDGEARQDFNKTEVYADTDNTVEIFTAEIKPGKWAWGYNFYTKNGRNEFRFPSLEYGYCRSERDAKLYILGLLLANGSMFTRDAVAAIGNMIKELQQLSLFTTNELQDIAK